jgi:outer membrane immunogenic protein
MHRFQCGVLAAATVLGFASIASAADMPLPAAAPAIYDWSGVYVGGHVGGGWASNAITDDEVLSAIFVTTTFTGANQPVQTVNGSGFLGGVQAGANYQIGKLVVGAEGDFSWGAVKGSNTAFLINGHLFPFLSFNRNLTANTTGIGTVTARMGIAHDRWLIYGKGGVAWARTNYTESDIAPPPTSPLFTGSATEARVGWTAGAGIEWAFWSTWSAKLEYDFLNFGSRVTSNYGSIGPGNIAVTAVPITGALQNNQLISEVKFGINYKFMQNIW